MQIWVLNSTNDVNVYITLWILTFNTLPPWLVPPDPWRLMKVLQWVEQGRPSFPTSEALLALSPWRRLLPQWLRPAFLLLRALSQPLLLCWAFLCLKQARLAEAAHQALRGQHLLYQNSKKPWWNHLWRLHPHFFFKHHHWQCMSLKLHAKLNLHYLDQIVGFTGLRSQNWPIPNPLFSFSWATLHASRIPGSHRSTQDSRSYILVCREPQKFIVSWKQTLSVFLRAPTPSLPILFSLHAEILEQWTFSFVLIPWNAQPSNACQSAWWDSTMAKTVWWTAPLWIPPLALHLTMGLHTIPSSLWPSTPMEIMLHWDRDWSMVWRSHVVLKDEQYQAPVPFWSTWSREGLVLWCSMPWSGCWARASDGGNLL